VIGVTKARLEARASIGAFNVIRNVSSFVLESGAILGQFNWVTGGSTGILSESSRLFLGKESAVTSRHYIDVSGAVTVGAFSTVAGERSVILTHQIDYRESRQTLAAVHIGQYALVSSNVKIVPGASVPDFSVVAMGSVVAPGLIETSCLYAGIPAKPRRRGIHGRYFERLTGPVYRVDGDSLKCVTVEDVDGGHTLD
jgi:acetyltransferase-like isoleucine patch superfamily enzyme